MSAGRATDAATRGILGPAFEAHLGGCLHCAGYLAQIRKMIELTRSLTPGDLTLQMQPYGSVTQAA
jgi:hypothetical protein